MHLEMAVEAVARLTGHPMGDAWGCIGAAKHDLAIKAILDELEHRTRDEVMAKSQTVRQLSEWREWCKEAGLPAEITHVPALSGPKVTY
jgi:hypothetical protein